MIGFSLFIERETHKKRGSVARWVGVGGRDSRRQASMDGFTASRPASDRAS